MKQTIHLPTVRDPTLQSLGPSAQPCANIHEIGDDRFARRLATDGQTLERAELSTLQLNLGKMCNLACHHCHVEAGPDRTEIMTWRTMAHILDWFDSHRGELNIRTVDLTGGSPEMNPYFRQLVQAFRARGVHVLDRCNLTILLHTGYEDLVEFLATTRVEIVASLPCYLEHNVDKQRGKGVFHDSIIALKKLNNVGYGQPQTDLRLDLVFNPVGYSLPPDQAELETAYRQRLSEDYSVVFNNLWSITNMPIKRFEQALQRDGVYDTYTNKLFDAHNPNNVASVMCRYLVSVGWQGAVYDCDFNQMLQMPIAPDRYGPGSDEQLVESHSRKLWEYAPTDFIGRGIRTAGHCFGCTAGAGSSCTGALS